MSTSSISFHNFFLLCLLLLIGVGCSTTPQADTKVENTHSSGTLTVLADIAYKPFMETSIETFQALYPKAAIQVRYVPQETAFEAMMNKEVDVVIAGREFSAYEIQKIKQRALIPKVNLVAYDGIVIVASKERIDTVISTNQLKSLLEEKSNVKLLCDRSNSGNLMYLQGLLKYKGKASNLFACGSDSAVIEYVKNHPEDLGIIGMALVSDMEDPKVKKLRTGLRMLSIASKDSTGKTKISAPTLDQLAVGDYPFKKSIFILNLDAASGLGTGFANFLTSERGQRIFLKSGLLPYRMPTREILIVDKL